jgi:translation initiation factor IF-2
MPTPTAHKLTRRPPVIVVMGHIDHGKSSLLDYIRKTNVVAGEAGGITQHVGAYEATYTGADGTAYTLTFIDTPGHAAFGGIRERGALAADIALLVVSAEDGVKPQTVEAWNVIKARNMPVIVVVSKTDKPNANIEKAKQSLGEHEIYVEGWGGDLPCLPVSSVSGEGIPELLEMILIVSEIANLTTDHAAPASGVVVESSRDNRKGNSATLLVRNGTLSVGDVIVAGTAYTPVRFIENFKGEKIASATASMPLRILGWNVLPESGVPFTTVATKKEAEKIIETKLHELRSSHVSPMAINADSAVNHSAATSAETATADAPKTIVSVPLILKADVAGSLEGVKFELSKISHERVMLDIVSEGIGDINENDVKMALSDPAITVIGFNSEPDSKSATQIERSAVPIHVKTFKIIYDLVEFVQSLLTAQIPKEYVEEVTGRAKIMAIFSKDKDRQIVGGKVETGTIGTGNAVRLIRREAEIGRGTIRELQEKKIRAKEVAEGHEFGMMVECKMEIAPGDRVEAVHTVEKK